MPFKSEAQRRFMYSQHPELAKEFEKATPEGKSLPEHVPQKMSEGGITDILRRFITGDKGEQAVKHDVTEASAADAVDPVVSGSTDTAKGYDDGGAVDPHELDIAQSNALVNKNEPGMKDATASDFLLPYLLGPTAGKIVDSIPTALEGLGEAGEATLGRAAPEMEGLAAKKPDVEVFIKGVQKGGEKPVKLYGVKGKPEEVAKLGFGTDPATIPEHILRQHGLLPDAAVDVPTQSAPNAYAEGGKVNYPHVTFLENESPATVNKVTHVEHAHKTENPITETGHDDNPKHMSEGGKTPHFLEGLKKGALHKEMGVSEDKKIPEHKLEKAVNSDNETLRKRAQFAINAKKWHHADGGIIEGLKKDAEPAKPADVEPSHEEKLKSIYKAMGMKKYADGGEVAPSDGTINVADLPGQGPTPNPSDPGFWDTIKAALAKVGAPMAGAANVAAMPAEAASAIAPAIVPVAAGAINRITGSSLPVLPPTAAPAQSAAPTAAVPGPMPTGPVSPMAAVTPTQAAAPAGPNLKDLFNQDTSKLTAGVNPEDRQALVAKLAGQQHGIASVIAEAVSGLGDALAAKGGREQHSLQNIFSMQKDQRAEALANFDQARQDRLQKLDLQTKMGQNAIQGLAAQDAYGTDEHLNKMLGAPPGTAHKDLPLYFQAKTAQVAQQEKDADLYMKAHAQAISDVDNAVKNSTVLGFKPSMEQIQAMGEQRAHRYYSQAKGLYHSAKNPQTGHQIESYDGGQTWVDAGAK